MFLVHAVKAKIVAFSRRRNDAIKHVREAAELALSRIGGDEVEHLMKVTQVLTSEMHNLRGTSS